MNKAVGDLGLVGLGVMGCNLALNLGDHGYVVAGFDHSEAAVERFTSAPRPNGTVAFGFYDLRGLVAVCRRPRAIMLLVPAGRPVDDTIAALTPLLQEGDSIIDGGNSHYKDTVRRVEELQKKNLHFLGMGVSGGEEGARRGPSLMAGGDPAAWRPLEPKFGEIAALAQGRACFARVGPDGAGHFVKTLHNGIEYAAMQLLAEAYFIGRYGLGLTHQQLHDTFATWQDGPLGSFLLDVTVDVLGASDGDTGQAMLDIILDRASQKGTGQWSANAALEYGVAAPTISEAVHARCLSGARMERAAGAAALGSALHPHAGDVKRTLAHLHDALLTASLIAYAQGFAVIRAASAEHNWQVPLQRLAQIWQGGCIIRAKLLDDVEAAFTTDPNLSNLLLAPQITEKIKAAEAGLRAIVALAVTAGLPIPALASALSYLDGLRSGRIWANMIEAQRDYFGAHGFERLDKPGKFHHQWRARP